MKISLRKANTIQNNISEFIKNYSIVTDFYITEFEDVTETLNKKCSELITKYNKRDELLSIQYSIRDHISNMNQQSGISVYLTQCALLDKKIENATLIVKCTPSNVSVVSGALEKAKQKTNSFSSNPYTQIGVSAVTQDIIDTLSADLYRFKLEKQKLNDKILELNIKTEITLDDGMVSILKEHNLI